VRSAVASEFAAHGRLGTGSGNTGGQATAQRDGNVPTGAVAGQAMPGGTFTPVATSGREAPAGRSAPDATSGSETPAGRSTSDAAAAKEMPGGKFTSDAAAGWVVPSRRFMTGAVSRREVPSRGRSTRVLPSGPVPVEEFSLRKLAARTIRNDEFAATAPAVTPSRLAGYPPSAASDRRGSVDGSSPEPRANADATRTRFSNGHPRCTRSAVRTRRGDRGSAPEGRRNQPLRTAQHTPQGRFIHSDCHANPITPRPDAVGKPIASHTAPHTQRLQAPTRLWSRENTAFWKRSAARYQVDTPKERQHHLRGGFPSRPLTRRRQQASTPQLGTTLWITVENRWTDGGHLRTPASSPPPRRVVHPTVRLAMHSRRRALTCAKG